MQFNFNFGNKKPTIVQYAIIGVVLASLIGGLSKCTGINTNTLWDFLDEIQRNFFPQTHLNDFFLQDPGRLRRRIHRDVDRAIDQVTPEYDRIIREADKKYQPRYMDLKIDESECYTDGCKALAPPMRICNPVYEGLDDCPKE